MSSWTDLEKVPWDYWNTIAEYTALSLNEFRGFDGNYLPFEPDGSPVDANDLPAIGTVQTDVSGEKQANAWRDGLAMNMSILDLPVAVEGAHTRLGLEAKVKVIRTITNDQDAIRTKLGNPTLLFVWTFEPVRFVPWLDETRRSLSAWEFQFILRLQGTRIVEGALEP